MLAAAAPAEAQVLPDSSYVRFEVGGASDVTNENYYEDTFDDTTFTGTRTTGKPEYGTAAVGAFEAAMLSARAGRVRLRQELTAGNRLSRSFTRLEWGGEPGDGVRLLLAPELEMRRDRSFGADSRELRFRPDGRVRFTTPDRSHTWELQVGGDWLRTSGTSDVTTLDRNAGRAWLRWGHAPLDAVWEMDLGYGADARAFPDSVQRGHIEQHATLGLRRILPGAGSATLDVLLDRRDPFYATLTTRDRFWSGRADASAFIPFHERLTAEIWASLDGYRYDEPDTSVYFDYRLWTARPALHWLVKSDWGVRVGPRLEWLEAPGVPAERYREVAGVLELEWLHRGDWWSLSPSAGWRQYEHSSDSLSLAAPELHSSYLFLEGEAFADVGIPGNLRLRFSGTARHEAHDDPSQDATSIYLSLDVRLRF